jgi:ATP-dependent DNA ligase
MSAMPIALMLATLTDRRDFGDDWLLERKFDGERCVARKDGGEVRLQSRTAKDLTGPYPEVRAAVASQRDRKLLLDGEVVAYDGGQTSFSRLQQRLGSRTRLPSGWPRIRSCSAPLTCSSSTATISETGRCSSAAPG